MMDSMRMPKSNADTWRDHRNGEIGPEKGPWASRIPAPVIPWDSPTSPQVVEEAVAAFSRIHSHQNRVRLMTLFENDVEFRRALDVSIELNKAAGRYGLVRVQEETKAKITHVWFSNLAPLPESLFSLLMATREASPRWYLASAA